LSRGTVCKLRLAFVVQLVHIVGVTAADVAADEQLDLGDGVVRFIPRDGVQGATCVCRAAGAYR